MANARRTWAEVLFEVEKQVRSKLEAAPAESTPGANYPDADLSKPPYVASIGGNIINVVMRWVTEIMNANPATANGKIVKRGPTKAEMDRLNDLYEKTFPNTNK